MCSELFSCPLTNSVYILLLNLFQHPLMMGYIICFVVWGFGCIADFVMVDLSIYVRSTYLLVAGGHSSCSVVFSFTSQTPLTAFTFFYFFLWQVVSVLCCTPSCQVLQADNTATLHTRRLPPYVTGVLALLLLAEQNTRDKGMEAEVLTSPCIIGLRPYLMSVAR